MANEIKILPAVKELAEELKIEERAGQILFPYVLEIMQLAHRQGGIDALRKLEQQQLEQQGKVIVH
jgi:hypothetical protein